VQQQRVQPAARDLNELAHRGRSAGGRA
jgi:hypothetical protein